ncbi:phage major capsid protein [Yoonia sp.]|nr:phage major capsid protein [Yoonia sp.]
MNNTESDSRVGEDVSLGQELKTAIAGFMNDFKDFSHGLNAKLQKQDDRMNKLDRKTMMNARPVLAMAATHEAPHQKAFAAYLRSGDDDALRGLELDGKAMGTSIAADGGYLVDPQTADTIKGTLSATASIRAVANVVNVDATSYDVLVDHTEMGAGWATESGGVSETDTPQIDRITIPLHELSALPKASQRLLDDSAFDIEGWLAGRIADKFARSEAGAFINGDGVDKPKGVLTYPTVDNDVWAWGNIGYVPTGTAGGIDGGDAVVDLVYALGAEYRANGTFLLNSKTAGTIRKLKDNDGRFLWSDGLAAGEPARLMGYPVLIAEDMPDIAPDAMAIAFGDFGAGYTVAERPDLRVLRDPFSAKPHVLFYATKRVGGAVSDFGAIKLLKFATS